MKKLLIFVFLMIGLSGMAQKPLKAFLSPVPNDLFKSALTIDRDITSDYKASVWMLRPYIGVTAIHWNWDKDSKQFNASAFNSFGLGAGWQHFIEVNGQPYNNYGANALLILGEQVSAAVTFSAFSLFNFGAVYNITLKQPGILTGVKIIFN